MFLYQPPGKQLNFLYLAGHLVKFKASPIIISYRSYMQVMTKWNGDVRNLPVVTVMCRSLIRAVIVYRW